MSNFSDIQKNSPSARLNVWIVWGLIILCGIVVATDDLPHEWLPLLLGVLIVAGATIGYYWPQLFDLNQLSPKLVGAIGLALMVLLGMLCAGQQYLAYLISLVFWTTLACLYLLPAIIAHKRQHPQHMAIGVLNLLLGWTLLGWVGALVWSLT